MFIDNNKKLEKLIDEDYADANADEHGYTELTKKLFYRKYKASLDLNNIDYIFCFRNVEKYDKNDLVKMCEDTYEGDGSTEAYYRHAVELLIDGADYTLSPIKQLLIEKEKVWGGLDIDIYYNSLILPLNWIQNLHYVYIFHKYLNAKSICKSSVQGDDCIQILLEKPNAKNYVSNLTNEMVVAMQAFVQHYNLNNFANICKYETYEEVKKWFDEWNGDEMECDEPQRNDTDCVCTSLQNMEIDDEQTDDEIDEQEKEIRQKIVYKDDDIRYILQLMQIARMAKTQIYFCTPVVYTTNDINIKPFELDETDAADIEKLNLEKYAENIYNVNVDTSVMVKIQTLAYDEKIFDNINEEVSLLAIALQHMPLYDCKQYAKCKGTNCECTQFFYPNVTDIEQKCKNIKSLLEDYKKKQKATQNDISSVQSKLTLDTKTYFVETQEYSDNNSHWYKRINNVIHGAEYIATYQKCTELVPVLNQAYEEYTASYEKVKDIIESVRKDALEKLKNKQMTAEEAVNLQTNLELSYADRKKDLMEHNRLLHKVKWAIDHTRVVIFATMDEIK